MQDKQYIIFIAFACIWIIIGVAAVIALLKSENQEIRFGKWGLIVAIPIIVPFVFTLIYQVVRPLILRH
ncbi:MAG TPA: hypothetical protein V6D15_22760 [Oculatellaceae cyanobacterium]|jgi:predicted neutral ceramidase superfamily lipid hydrolase